MRLRPLAPFLLAFCLAALPAGAVPLAFDCISDNDAGDCAIGEAQLTVDVTDPGGGQIDFLFENAGPAASSITAVYWDDDGVLAGIFSITNTPGLVEFAVPATPGDLPAGNQASPPFQTTPGFSADSDPPAQPNGVNPGEQLLVTFTLQAGQTFDDVLAALADGSLRVGIQVQGFASEGGESFVNVPVPEPGTAALLGGGLVAVAAARRKTRRNR